MVEKKRVLMYSTGRVLAERQTGGIKRFLELTKYLCRFYDVTLCSQDDNSVSSITALKYHIQLKTPSPKWWYKPFPQELRIFFENYSLLKMIKKDKYDYVIVFDVPPAMGLSLMRIRNIVLMIRKDLIACADAASKHSFFSIFFNKSFLWFCESFCLKKANLICCQCNYDLNSLKKRHPLLSNLIGDKSFVQINNVNPLWTQDSHQVLDSASFCFNDGYGFKICFVGDFDNLRKGQDIMLEAARRLRNDEDIHTYIVGGGDSLDEFKKAYPDKNITFTGRLKYPKSIMSRCDLVVVPSRTDSCPNVILEAFDLGIPVIGSKAGGIPELLLDDNALFDLDVVSLEHAIRIIKDNSNLRKDIIKKQEVRKLELTFDWGERITRRIIQN